MFVANDMQPKLSPFIPRPCLPELRSRMTCSLLSRATSPCWRLLEYGKVHRSFHAVASRQSWYCFQAYPALAQRFCNCSGLSCYRPEGCFVLISQLSAKHFFALMQAVHVISLIADPAVKVKTCSQRLMKSYVLHSQRCQLPNDDILRYTLQYLTFIHLLYPFVIEPLYNPSLAEWSKARTSSAQSPAIRSHRQRQAHIGKHYGFTWFNRAGTFRIF